MITSRDIALVVGSLRKGSYNRLAARALSDLAPAGHRLRFIEIGDLPLYNEDLDHGDAIPEPWTMLRNSVVPADAVLFVTPEYNRSVPAVLKNALDVGSRPYGHSVWAKKPAAIMSVSPGAIGGFGANHHLRQSLVFLDMPILQQPEAYIGQAATLFADDGTLANEQTRELFTRFMAAFAAWISQVTS
ncbi:MAG: NAD(P)H-dependent oxidoreductase [Novosphingobium sp.]